MSICQKPSASGTLRFAGALEQIGKLHYADALKEFDPVRIYKYAVACYKKHCRVVMEEEQL